MKVKSYAMLAAVAAGMAAAGVEVNVSFANGAWKADDFIATKSWRWDYMGKFDQLPDGIVNHCPDLPGEMIYKKHHGDVYAALVHKTKFEMGHTVSSTMMFDYRMAPIIVLAPELGKSEKSGEAEFRDHWEVCLYDCGINVWHHYFEDGKQKWFKAAAIVLPEGQKFLANVKYDLQVTVARTRKGQKNMVVRCGGYELSYVDESLPESFLAGIIACEGRNFFYDFRIKPAAK